MLCHVSWAFHSHSRLSLFVSDSRWILHLGSRRQFRNSLLIVTTVQIFCFNRQIFENWTCLILLSLLWWHWTLFPPSCWWLLFLFTIGEKQEGIFQLLLIHHRLDCYPQAWDCLVSLCNMTWGIYSKGYIACHYTQVFGIWRKGSFMSYNWSLHWLKTVSKAFVTDFSWSHLLKASFPWLFSLEVELLLLSDWPRPFFLLSGELQQMLHLWELARSLNVNWLRVRGWSQSCSRSSFSSLLTLSSFFQSFLPFFLQHTSQKYRQNSLPIPFWLSEALYWQKNVTGAVLVALLQKEAA